MTAEPTRHFTVHADPDIDRRIEEDLRKIATRFAAAVPGLTALVLVGAFGRGEGSVVRESGVVRPVNDYDLVLVHAPGAPPPDLAPVRRALAHELALTHLDVEVLAAEDLPRLPPSMHAHDLKHGGRQIQGEAGVEERIPPISGTEVGAPAARVLLFNRLTCLLEAVTASDLAGEPPPGRRFGMAYMAHKVMLSVAAAMLARAGDYHASYRERAVRFAHRFPNRPALAAQVEDSTRFKLDPPALVPDPRALWFRVRDVYLALLKEAVEEVHGVPFATWEEFASVHEGNRARDRVRKLKWWFLDRRKYEDIAGSQLRVDVELAEIFLTAAPVPGGAFSRDLTDAARRRLAGHTALVLPDWESCRAECVRLDLTHVHPA